MPIWTSSGKWNPEIRVSIIHPKFLLRCNLATNSGQNGQSWIWVCTDIHLDDSQMVKRTNFVSIVIHIKFRETYHLC